MPPANSPDEQASTSTTPVRSFDHHADLILESARVLLRRIASETDLAADQSTRDSAMQDGHPIDSDARPPSYSSSPPRLSSLSTITPTSVHDPSRSYLTEDEFRHFTETSRRRMLRNIHRDRASRQAEDAFTPTAQSYSDRTPQRESLYDWATTRLDGSDYHVDMLIVEDEQSEDSEDGDTPSSRPMSQLLQHDLSNDLSHHDAYHRRRRMRAIITPGQHHRTLAQEGTTSPSWSEDLQNVSRSSGRSLSATRALLQSVERHRRFNERARESIQGFIVDRDRLNHDRDRSRNRTGNEIWNDPSTVASLVAHQRERERKLDDKNRLDSHSTKVARAIQYLSDLRNCESISDGEVLAAKYLAGQSTSSSTDQVLLQLPNLVLDTDSITKPQYSSWLTPGSTFTGSQQTSQEPTAILLNRDRDYLRRMVANRNLSSANMAASVSILMDVNRHMSNILAESTPANSSNPPAISFRHDGTVTSSPTNRRRSQNVDKWPVSVTLHSVDLSTMSLTGTMTASHIPDKLSPSSPDHRPEGSSMESFFEGEIIDFNNYILETTNFRTEGTITDVEYWRKLGPFRDLCNLLSKEEEKDDELARSLTDKSWLNGLNREWILMRWKERCFTTTSSQSWGLTISGFYYIAMRRLTGQIEGLYYDPGSQPYQQLNLMPKGNKAEEGLRGCVKKEFWAMEMR